MRRKQWCSGVSLDWRWSCGIAKEKPARRKGKETFGTGPALSPTRTGWNLAEACRSLRRAANEGDERERRGIESDLTLALSSRRGDGFEAVWWVGRAPLSRPPERAETLQRLAEACE